MEHRKFFCIALAGLLFVLCVVTGHAQVIAIKAGKLVDPETGATILLITIKRYDGFRSL